jgi:hypothetical protein
VWVGGGRFGKLIRIMGWMLLLNIILITVGITEAYFQSEVFGMLSLIWWKERGRMHECVRR